MEKLFKFIISGIVAGFILFVVASIAYNFNHEISDPSIKYFWREKISMAWFYKLLIINVVFGLVFAFFYSIIQNGLPGSTILKGIFFGFMLWALMVSPPLVTAFLAGSFTKSLLISWLLQGLTSYVAAGISISLIYK